MDTLTFIVEMSRAWAWPLTVAVLGIVAFMRWPRRETHEAAEPSTASVQPRLTRVPS
jgi:hypothetical protein